MKTIALFNNKGGVGRTSLAYHLGFMFAELGKRVLLADLDPQASLSSMCLAEDRLEAIWALKPRPTIYGAMEPLLMGTGDIEPGTAEPVFGNIGLLVGDLLLSELEEELSQQWSRCLLGDKRSFHVTTAIYRVVAAAGAGAGSDIAVLDVAPSFGAVNRAALIGADYVIVPVTPDLFSIQGLENIGPRLNTWRHEWADRTAWASELDFDLPAGTMWPLGYVVSRLSGVRGGMTRSFQRWIDRIPAVFRQSFGLPPGSGTVDVESDEYCLARLKDFRSLMPMAQEAKKPMFLLKPADGAIGGHQAAVRQAYQDFRALAVEVLKRMDAGASPAPSSRSPAVAAAER